MSSVVLIGHRGFVGTAIAAHLRSIGIPFEGVDRENAARFTDLLAELEVAVIMVTHAPELAGKMGRVLELRAGKLV